MMRKCLGYFLRLMSCSWRRLSSVDEMKSENVFRSIIVSPIR